ncbi:protein TWIN LOV 1 isoform X4 [Mangifera indica]|uniref:protein TWIN LOV 1 isoform X4 n=1 Tax=Mangifera indica TaxID=29780 RepID=UPI001CFAEB8C|nr:protein TWIN LOV 1 isoform X4 [Mangifera indica]
MDSQLGLIEQSFNSRYTFRAREALDDLPDNFTITDPSISGHPIVFASRGFMKMSGYSREEIIGKNGRLFQGPGTNQRTVMEIREAIREERAIEVNLLNYRKDGTPFWMLFRMSPVFCKQDGRVTNFVACQVPIVSRKRGRNCGFGFSGKGNQSEFREIVFGSCRSEICSDSLLDLDRVLALQSDSQGHAFYICLVSLAGLENEETCEASELEKQKAATAINNILSVLTYYSASTGKLVCEKRCGIPGVDFINSSLRISLGRIKQSFVLTDPHLPDVPIVYASDAFLKLTGYDRHEVLGHNCGFLNGSDTDPATLYQIKESIRAEQACTVRILNYRKDKTSFWCLLHMSPIRNASGKVAYFASVQTEEGCKSADRHGLSPEKMQLSAIGAIKVAVRSSSMGACSSKSICK